MRRASISEAKSRFSSCLKDVKRGETVLIFDRGKQVARLEPVNIADLPEEDRMGDLVSAGLASAPRRKLDVKAFLSWPRPRLPKGVKAAKEVVQQRNDP
ncbi:MAG TPA: hypothetical protein VMU36_06980 [Spirochaetia bacterium]|nr:hypothetical protein [Spirochaetia bacterium]